MKKDRAIFGLEPEYYEEQVVQKAIKNVVEFFGLKLEQLFTNISNKLDDIVVYVEEKNISEKGYIKVPIYINHFTTNLQGEKVFYPIHLNLNLDLNRSIKILHDIRVKLDEELNRLEKELEEYANMVLSYNVNTPITEPKSKTPITDAILKIIVETGEAKHLGDIYFY